MLVKEVFNYPSFWRKKLTHEKQINNNKNRDDSVAFYRFKKLLISDFCHYIEV